MIMGETTSIIADDHSIIPSNNIHKNALDARGIDINDYYVLCTCEYADILNMECYSLYHDCICRQTSHEKCKSEQHKCMCDTSQVGMMMKVGSIIMFGQNTKICNGLKHNCICGPHQYNHFCRGHVERRIQYPKLNTDNYYCRCMVSSPAVCKYEGAHHHCCGTYTSKQCRACAVCICMDIYASNEESDDNNNKTCYTSFHDCICGLHVLGIDSLKCRYEGNKHKCVCINYNDKCKAESHSCICDTISSQDCKCEKNHYCSCWISMLGCKNTTCTIGTNSAAMTFLISSRLKNSDGKFAHPKNIYCYLPDGVLGVIFREIIKSDGGGNNG